jgi:hypothetical protein
MTRARSFTLTLPFLVALALATCAPPTPRTSGVVTKAQTLDELSFYGEQQLRGQECSSQGGCTTRATLTHYNRMDLGWSTILHTGRTAAALEPRSTWTGVKVTAYCRVYTIGDYSPWAATSSSGPAPATAFAQARTSCGTWSLLTGSTNARSTLRFSRDMSGVTGVIRVSFTGTWRGSSYTVHGYMPLFRCYLTEHQCRFL